MKFVCDSCKRKDGNTLFKYTFSSAEVIVDEPDSMIILYTFSPHDYKVGSQYEFNFPHEIEALKYDSY